MSLERRPRPPLTKRLRPWHWMAIDLLVGGLVGLGGVLGSRPDIVTVPSRLLLAAAITVPVVLRRRYPLAAFCGLVVLGVAGTVTGLGVPAGVSFIYCAAAYALYALTVSARRPVGFVALTLVLAVIATTVILAHLRQIPADRGRSVLAWAVLALIIAWMTGDSARQRRRYAQLLQQEAASSAVAGERLRIARELHDVVAHSMSVIAVQAGYGQYVIDVSPADAREALGAIQATSRDALEEMRRMLGVLRPEQPDAGAGPDRPRTAPLAPAPGLDDVDRLIQRTSGADVEVSLERSGQICAVPAGVELSAYRIIQEALTNVVRHAGAGARCTVRLAYEESTLHVVVTDNGGRPLVPAAAALSKADSGFGSGHGLVGMRERALLCGGDFTAGPRPDGGFQVAAALPLDRLRPADAGPLDRLRPSDAGLLDRLRPSDAGLLDRLRPSDAGPRPQAGPPRETP